MSERLDQIEAILLSVAQQQAQNTQQLAQNTRDIDALVEGISNTDVLLRQTIQQAREDRQAMEASLQADRQAMEASLQADREEYRRLSREQDQRIQNLLDDARADRQRADEERRRADEERAQQAQRLDQHAQQIQAMIVQADEDRAENRRRFDAQQEILRAMLVELSVVNSRLDNIERAG